MRESIVRWKGMKKGVGCSLHSTSGREKRTDVTLTGDLSGRNMKGEREKGKVNKFRKKISYSLRY